MGHWPEAAETCMKNGTLSKILPSGGSQYLSDSKETLLVVPPSVDRVSGISGLCADA